MPRDTHSNFGPTWVHHGGGSCQRYGVTHSTRPHILSKGGVHCEQRSLGRVPDGTTLIATHDWSNIGNSAWRGWNMGSCWARGGGRGSERRSGSRSYAHLRGTNGNTQIKQHVNIGDRREPLLNYSHSRTPRARPHGRTDKSKRPESHPTKECARARVCCLKTEPNY
jgi:hypothetical protein